MGIRLVLPTSGPLQNDADAPISTRKSRARRKVMNSEDKIFESRLVSWREITARALLGDAVVDNIGPDAFIADTQLDRIIACTQARRITSPDDIIREVDWDLVKDHAQAIFDLISTSYTITQALPATSATPAFLEDGAEATSAFIDSRIPGGVTRTKPRSCGACGGKGHNRM